MDSYFTLKQAIENATLRTDIPFDNLLVLANRAILRRLRTQLMADRYSVDFGDTEQDTVVLPPQFIELISLTDQFGNHLGCHRVGKNLLLDKPLKNVTVTAEYYKRPADINANNTTSPLLTEYPSIYYYAVMSEAYVWLQDLDRAGYYSQLANNEITAINSESIKETSTAQNITTNLGGLT